MNNTQPKSFTQKIYKALSDLNVDNSDKVKGKWEKYVSIIENEDWEAMCSQPSKVLVSNTFWEKQFKILHRLYIIPEARHRMNPMQSDLCIKC